MKVGIPRAALYYKYFPLWENFFKELGATPVFSEPTNTRILNIGVKAATSEICLPVKVFLGHVLDLKDQVDCVFVPSIVSPDGLAYTCPKFIGLPDLARSLEDCPEIITAKFNLKQKKKEFYKAVYEIGKKFNKNPLKVHQAFKKGMVALREHEASLLSRATNSRDSEKLKIGVVGHPYNIYDDHISLNLIKRLKKQGVAVETLEMIPSEQIAKHAKSLPKEVFWTYEKELVGAVLHWLNNKTVDGIIYMLSFACGPDSLMQVIIEDKAKNEQEIPLMSLVIDEHSAEAGMITRIEAFLECLKRRKNK